MRQVLFHSLPKAQPLDGKSSLRQGLWTGGCCLMLEAGPQDAPLHRAREEGDGDEAGGERLSPVPRHEGQEPREEAVPGEDHRGGPDELDGVDPAQRGPEAEGQQTEVRNPHLHRERDGRAVAESEVNRLDAGEREGEGERGTDSREAHRQQEGCGEPVPPADLSDFDHEVLLPVRNQIMMKSVVISYGWRRENLTEGLKPG